MTIQTRIKEIKSKLEWFKGESYARKTVEDLTYELHKLEQQLLSGKKDIKVLDIPQ